MPTVEERVTNCELSILKLATNKLDTNDLSSLLTAINARLANLETAVASILTRVEAIEQDLINRVVSS